MCFFFRLYEGIQTNFNWHVWIQHLDILLMVFQPAYLQPTNLSYSGLLSVVYVFCKLEWDNL